MNPIAKHQQAHQDPEIDQQLQEAGSNDSATPGKPERNEQTSSASRQNPRREVIPRRQSTARCQDGASEQYQAHEVNETGKAVLLIIVKRGR